MPDSSPPSTAELLRARILIAKSAGAKKGTKKKSPKLIANENDDPSQPERKRRKSVTVACVCYPSPMGMA